MIRLRGDGSGEGPWSLPLPHFHEQTIAYFEGNFQVLDQLPAVQESALHRAKQSATLAVLLEKQSRHREEGREEALLQPRRTPRLPSFTSKPPFSEMVRCKIPLVTTPVPSQRERVGDQRQNKSLQDADHTAPRGRPQVYDGLRSSPPRSLTSPHTWKVYTGPFSSSHPVTTKTDQHSNHPNHPNTTTTEQPPQTTTHLQPPPIPESTPIPKLQLATLAIRSTPKEVTIPSRRAAPKPTTPFTTSPLPSRPSYTSRAGRAALASLRFEILEPPPYSSSPRTIIASLLPRWSVLRNTLPRHDPLLARLIGEVDWRGVECEFAEGSFKRRAVEGWVLEVGRGRDGDGEDWRWWR